MLLTHYLVIYFRPFPLSLPHSQSIRLDFLTNPGVPEYTFLSFWDLASLDHDLAFFSQSTALKSKRGLRATSQHSARMKTNVAEETLAAE